MRINNPSVIKGDRQILAAYEYLEKEGDATPEQMAEAVGAGTQAFIHDKMMRMNGLLVDHGKEKRFSFSPGKKGKRGYPPLWSLKPAPKRTP
jgi:hypothetical protein